MTPDTYDTFTLPATDSGRTLSEAVADSLRAAGFEVTVTETEINGFPVVMVEGVSKRAPRSERLAGFQNVDARKR